MASNMGMGGSMGGGGSVGGSVGGGSSVGGGMGGMGGMGGTGGTGAMADIPPVSGMHSEAELVHWLEQVSSSDHRIATDSMPPVPAEHMAATAPANG
jgi:hypothetical protein